MKISRPLFVFILLNFILISANAQNYIIKIWPDGIPGSITSDSYKEKATITDGIFSRFEKVTDPSIFVFLPSAGKSTGAAILICPGGGYGGLAFAHEGFAIAKWLNENGIAGIILKYRLPSDIIMNDKSIGPLQDAQESIRIIRRNASVWKINPMAIGVLGFSAGGHLASTLSTHYAEKVYESADTTNARPDFSILIYPVITFNSTFTHAGSRRNLIGDNPTEEAIRHFSNELCITDKTPPTFLVHSADDSTVPLRNSIVYFEALQKNKISSELHVFRKGGHGYGLSINKGTQSGWPNMCLLWLRETLN